MLKTKNVAFFTSLFLAMALFSTTLYLSLKDDMNSLAIDTKAPSWIVYELTTTQYDIKGQKKYELNAHEWHHDETNHHADIKKPEIILYDDTHYPWFLKANYGEISRTALNNPAIKLWQDVKVTGAQDKKHESINASTQSLQIYPASHYAQTDEPITLVQKQHVIKSEGMQFYLNEKRVHLMNKVKAVYAPS